MDEKESWNVGNAGRSHSGGQRREACGGTECVPFAPSCFAAPPLPLNSKQRLCDMRHESWIVSAVDPSPTARQQRNRQSGVAFPPTEAKGRKYPYVLSTNRPCHLLICRTCCWVGYLGRTRLSPRRGSSIYCWLKLRQSPEQASQPHRPQGYFRNETTTHSDDLSKWVVRTPV